MIQNCRFRSRSTSGLYSGQATKSSCSVEYNIEKTGVVRIFGLSALALFLLNGVYFVLRISSGSFPRPLSAKEEREYLEKFAEGDVEARNILIEHNLRLVAHVIKKYYTASQDQDDLISIGTIGLIKGISTFKSAKGTRLATYAARCIENAILPLRLLFLDALCSDQVAAASSFLLDFY